MANETYQLIITGNAAGQFVQNVFHWRIDDNGFANRFLAAKGLIEGFLAANKMDNWLAVCPDSYIVQSIKARRVSNGGGPTYIDVSENGETGEVSDGMEVSANGPCVIWNTDGGARRIGKTFVPGISPLWMDGGEITAAAITTLLTEMNGFRTQFATVGGGAVTAVFCIPRHNAPATRSLVVLTQISKMIGKQRRRQLPV